MNDKIKEILKKYLEKVDFEIQGTCGIELPEKGKLSYISKAKYLKYLQANAGLFILTNAELYENIKEIPGNQYIVVEEPTKVFLEIHNAFYQDYTSFHIPLDSEERSPIKIGQGCQIHRSVVFGERVSLGTNVQIYPNVVIGSDVEIGNRTIVYSNVSIYAKVKIGSNCIIDAGAVIGGDGYRIIMDSEDHCKRLIHTGGVVIGNEVEIGSNSTIDRGTFKDTVIKDRVKIDNIVHISHNCFIDEDTRIAASACIGGSVHIGKKVVIWLGVTIRNGLAIGDNAEVLINSIVVSDVDENEVVGGFYAMDRMAWFNKLKDEYKNYVLPLRKKKSIPVKVNTPRDQRR